MPDECEAGLLPLVELRAWQVRDGQQRLVAEGFRTAEGATQVVWHVPETEIRGLLWIERLDGEKAPSG